MCRQTARALAGLNGSAEEGELSGEGNHCWCPHLGPGSQWDAGRAFVFNCS